MLNKWRFHLYLYHNAFRRNTKKSNSMNMFIISPILPTYEINFTSKFDV